MHRNQAAGAPTLTVETVVRSNGNLSLDDVFVDGGPPLPPGYNPDIYNSEPALGFYCLYRPRPGENSSLDHPDCPNITQVAKQHAEWLLSAGFDYALVDISNWPLMGPLGPGFGPSPDVVVFRPLEVLAEEWTALRAAGIPTPAIAAWPIALCGDEICMGGPEEGVNYASWRWILDNIYNNPKFDDVIHRVEGKKALFFPSPRVPAWNNQTLVDMAESNGGRNDVKVISMWAMDEGDFDKGAWGFFSTCSDQNQATTSMVDVPACNQSISTNGTPGSDAYAISASGSYMLADSAMPFAAPGHLRGLTMQRLFEEVLRVGAPNLFVSSFNEFIGGRHASVYPANTAANMGLPNDSQRRTVWVDTYGVEFSRDLEPNVEAGDRMWQVTTSCVSMYKAGRQCSDPGADTELCCNPADTHVFSNVWSLESTNSADALVTDDQGEKNALVGSGAWVEKCNPVPGSTVFCVNTSLVDARDGPFMIYNQPVAHNPTRALYRCITVGGQHFFSINVACESLGKLERIMGYIATAPGGEMLRGLRRCKAADGHRLHALDLPCDQADSEVLGFVR
eukprot:TRINITY_DN44893_c0_g1_i1.p1 TRINITY_DN44893_c0_g1~~TRINITY_DN44893_c0_g1_i1.p1  ORF type:complete len:565 (-),score=82.69 TRINITY_DN44893_c0_g1_i1:187-1881(-)